ncbi:MAG: matrixin family metalloprotease [Prevotellaceae bacterium]|jgi:hypothetical protein|nr:matrixin family metalloprotease [Prevotellaceae bacterium]
MKKILILFIVNLFVSSSVYSQRLYDNGALTGDGNYILQGGKWNKSTLNYYIYNTSSHLTSTQRELAITEAFKLWSDNSVLNFVKVSNSSQADLKIKWAAGNHGDNHPFDGNSGVLAHAYYPPPAGGSYAGELHFDDDESWSLDGSGIDLITVAAHEIGHLLGIEHSSVSSALMYPYYSGVRRYLDIDDKQAIWELYGYPSTITGPSNLCVNSSGTYTVSNPPASYTWVTGNNLVAGATSGNSKTFTALGSGQSSVSIRVGNTVVATYNIWLGEPTIPYVYSTERTHYNGTYTFTATHTGTNTPSGCVWRITGPLLSSPVQFTSSFPQGSYAFTNAPDGIHEPALTHYVTVVLNTSCGHSRESLAQQFKVQKGPLEMPIVYSAAYPNPASSELIIDRIEENGTEKTAINTQSAKGKTSEIRVLLYSHSTTQLVYNKTYSSAEKQIKIDTSKLPNGIYHLNIIENGEKIKEQTIIVSH